MGPTVLYYMLNVSTARGRHSEGRPNRWDRRTEHAGGRASGTAEGPDTILGRTMRETEGMSVTKSRPGPRGRELHWRRRFPLGDNFISVVTVS